MTIRSVLICLCVVSASSCGGSKWPDPPPVDEVKYRQEYTQLIDQQRETAAYALSIVGAWQLEEGDTPFGSAPGQPIVLPAKSVAPRAGVLRRSGDVVTVIPEKGVRLTREDGSVVTSGAPLDQGPPLLFGSIHVDSYSAPPAVFVEGRDTDAPALKDVRVDTFPLDPKWRVAARFDAFEKPRTIKIASTRGPVHDMTAVGQLVFRLSGQEFRLTALGEPSDEFFVMFKDDTNGSTTFSGYRMLSPKAVKNGEWTVLDFNFAQNPPCGYSKFTMCPLPPKENRVAMAVEAGVKRDPKARGYSE